MHESGIGRDTCSCDTCCRARHVYDVATICHQGQQRLGQEERPLEVSLEQSIELIFGDGFDRIIETISGIVDQIVEALTSPYGLKFCANCFPECWKGAAIGNIEFQCHGLSALCCDPVYHGRGRLGIAVVGDNDTHAGAGALQGGAGSDALAAAGDDNDLHVSLQCWGSTW